jgi:hypothetical protein
MTNYYIVNQQAANGLKLVDPNGVWFKEYTNYVCSFEEGQFVVVEEEDNYGDKSYHNPQTLPLVGGDIIYLSGSLEARDYIALKKLGVRVIFTNYRVEELPISEQTKNKKARLVYYLEE